MPRVHKPSLAELAEIRETYIVEGDEETLEKIIYQEQDVVKVFDRDNNHEDLWAIHELRDVTAVDQQGKIVNLLFCARDGHNFNVQGQLFVDQEFVKYLRTYRKKGFTHLNGSYIKVEKPDNISMGYSPLTLWISSVSGWLEIQPSTEYRPMYESMMHVVGLYFSAVVNTEERATDGMATPLPVAEDVREILTRYLVMYGGGAKVSEVIAACKQSKDFLLDQFRKKVTGEYWVAGVRNWKWLDSGFYRWVHAGFPEKPSNKLGIDPLVAKAVPPPPKPFGNTFKPSRRSATPVKMSQTPSITPPVSPAPTNPAPSQSAPQGNFPADLSPTITYTLSNGNPLVIDRWPRAPPKKEGLAWSRRTTSHHGVYASPEFPKGIETTMNNVDIFVAIGCHAKACDRTKELTATSLVAAFYWDFQINPMTAAHQVMNFYAKQIAAKFLALPGWGKDTLIYKSLMEVVYDDSRLKEDEVAAVQKLTVQGKKLEHRAKATARTSKAESAAPALVPASSASAPTTISSRPRKRASASPPSDDKKRSRRNSTSIVSRSREPSPAPAETTKYDSVGKVIPSRIKRRQMGFD
ncbi:hypothetical protein L207DRAFT_632729 [Hyaloscypha variabilis F]|uniref:Uncharacterized protein n=1 Tax=Hyaloscypha variabilis (strain UAMH 11265 / GT02V1 / F) TaxID=1149755 RepID=A0A2J6RRY3_HYAVF|nr:hypothetical protein L207DRAFT_632729 [Hyaloscypha variabilis F]